MNTAFREPLVTTLAGGKQGERRYATLVALAIVGTATVTDELVDLHDRILVRLFSAAKNKHQQQFQKQGKAINDKVRLYTQIGRALVEAKQAGMDLMWRSRLFCHGTNLRKASPRPPSWRSPSLLTTCTWSAKTQYASALYPGIPGSAEDARGAGRARRPGCNRRAAEMNLTGARKVPDDAPTAFIKARWRPLVLTDVGVDRRFYELCALSELKNSLWAGDIWVEGSRAYQPDRRLCAAPKQAIGKWGFRPLRNGEN